MLDARKQEMINLRDRASAQAKAQGRQLSMRCLLEWPDEFTQNENYAQRRIRISPPSNAWIDALIGNRVNCKIAPSASHRRNQRRWSAYGKLFHKADYAKVV